LLAKNQEISQFKKSAEMNSDVEKSCPAVPELTKKQLENFRVATRAARFYSKQAHFL